MPTRTRQHRRKARRRRAAAHHHRKQTRMATTALTVGDTVTPGPNANLDGADAFTQLTVTALNDDGTVNLTHTDRAAAAASNNRVYAGVNTADLFLDS